MIAATGQVSLESMPDPDLVACAKGGNPDCFASLYERHRPVVRRFLARMLEQSGPIDAEDVVQRAFLKAWEHLEQFRGEASFKSWLTRIAINEARMMRRKEKHFRDFISLDEPLADEEGSVSSRNLPPVTEPDFEMRVMMKDLEEAVRDSAERLAAPLRDVMLLRLSGLKVEEIAERLGITAACAKSRLYRARRHIEASLRCRVGPREGNGQPKFLSLGQATGSDEEPWGNAREG